MPGLSTVTHPDRAVGLLVLTCQQLLINAPSSTNLILDRHYVFGKAMPA